MTQTIQQSLPKAVPNPGGTIAGVIVIEVIPHTTPTGKVNPRLKVRCGCGEVFECTYAWARQVEMGTDTRNKNTTVRCLPCMRKKQSKKMKERMDVHHEQSRLKGVALTQEEEVRVHQIIRERVTACVMQGVGLGDGLSRFRIEAIEIVLIERRTGKDQFPRWTPDTIRQGLQERNYRQYEMPATGLL